MIHPPLHAPGAVAALVERRLAAIEAQDAGLRAMITVTADTAREQAAHQDAAAAAGRSSGPLAGMTVTLKDVIHTAGVRTTNGSAIDSDFVPDADAEVVRRLKAAGAIVLGKNSLHEYAYGGTTQNPFFGSCRNPWASDRIPGGSSGGSGVAVAAGMCCASLGTDTAGSGRLPAALCGVTGLRPTSGAIPNRGVTPVSAFFDTISPMARSVTEVAAVFRAIAGHDPLDPFSVPRTQLPPGPAGDGRLDGLRIGIPASYFLEGLDPGVEQATRAAIATLVALGAGVVVVDLPDPGATRGHFEALFHTDCAHEHRARYEAHADRLGADTRERLEMLGRSVTGMTYAAALSAMRVWQWQIATAFADVDLIAHPTAPMVAPTVAEAAGTTGTTRRLAVFLYPWSFAQVPVLSLPIGLAEHGLPCGLSLVAPQWHEERLFRVGEAFQRVTDWHLHHPPMLAAPVS